jgi:iron complex outermembrane receptor protein
MAKMQLKASNRTKVTALASTISAILGAAGSLPVYGQDSLDEVVVTGSRIVRRDLAATTPIMTVDTTRLENSSTLSVESVLNQMPQFNPAQNQFSAQGEIQTSPTGSLGIGSVNLRGIGTNRTLVLIDGRRAQPINSALVVDMNSIPSAAIERVETITGGASAVYGADAISGVVNFVLKDDFEGVSMDVQHGITERGDGEETRFSSLLGMNSDGGNANVLLGVEWYERDVSYQKNRDFYVDGWNDPNNNIPTLFPSMPAYAANSPLVPGQTGVALPSQAAVDSIFPQFAPGTIPRNSTFFFDPVTGAPYIRTATGSPGFNEQWLGRPDTGDGYYGLIKQGNGFIAQQYMDGALSSPLQRRSAFGKAHVDLTGNLRAFAQVNFTRTDVQTFSAGPPPAVGGNWGGIIPNDGRAIPAALQTLLDSRDYDPDGAGPLPAVIGGGENLNWRLNRGLDFIGQFGPSNTADTYQIVAGLEGTLERDMSWEVYYSSGNTTASNVYYGMPSVQRWQALSGAPNWGANAFVQIPGPSQAGNYVIQCDTGLPIFTGTTGSTSQNCLNNILGNYDSQSTVSQDIVEANVQGKILDMRSGELRFAAGASQRNNSFVYEPANAQSSIFDVPLGIFVSNPASGKVTVNELYGELLVPVLERLNLEFGYRTSDYSVGGGRVGTYKALFDWGATDTIRLRGGYNLANRAPNVGELFQSETAIFEGTFATGDPCQINTTATWGNVASNPNRLQVQQLCAALIGNNASEFGAPGSFEANNYQLGLTRNTGINITQVGNPNLGVEEAKTWTLGVVFSAPGGLDNLTASIDMYNIEIANAIASFNGQTIYSRCFNSDGLSNPGYTVNDAGGFCSLIARNEATGGVGRTEARYLNTGLLETQGIDLAANWVKDLPNGGSFSINSMLTYLDSFKTQTTPVDAPVEWAGTLGNPTNSGAGMYDYRINTTFGYSFGSGNANVGLRWRYLPEVKNGAYVFDKNTNVFPTESYSNFDLFAGYTFNERYQLRGGIDNVFDVEPAIVGALPGDTNSNSTLPGYYDPLGRRMYVGVKISF